MRIVPVNEYRVEVTLSPEELDGYDITYEQLDYADPDTRRVLWTLLSEIRRSSGVDLDLSGKLLIEATRETDGCCRVSFTSLPPRDGQNGSVKQLVKAGILDGVRGKGGGYRLDRAPERIGVLEVLERMEDSLAPVACLEAGAKPCPRSSACRTLPLWEGLNRVVSNYLAGFTVQDLIRREPNSFDYII